MRRTPTQAALSSTVIAVAGTGLLLFATVVIAQQRSESIPRYFLYQFVTLAVAAAVTFAVRVATGSKLQYLRIGELRAGATPVPLLGIAQGESWGKIGPTFAVIVTAVTGAFLWASDGTHLTRVTPSALLLALALALPLSFANAFTEEIVTR